MTAIGSILTWLGSEQVVLAATGVALKCAAIGCFGLSLTYLIAHHRSDLCNLVLRQVLLLCVVIPIVTMADLFLKMFGRSAETANWIFTLPAVTIDALSGVIGNVGSSSNWSPQSIALLLIFTGIAALLARIGYGTYLILRIRHRSEVVASPALLNVIERATTHAGLRNPAQVLFSKQTTVPFAGGVFRHFVILPASSQNWPQRELEMVLVHELLHINRRDSLWALIASLATALNWYNPLVWVVRRKMILEAERCCDAGVIREGNDASDYAGLLIKLARSARDRNTAIAFGSQILGMKLLEVRIMSILQAQIRSFSTSVRMRRSALLCTLMLLLPLAAMQLSGADRAKPESPVIPVNAAAADSADWPSPDAFIEVESPPERIYMPNPVYPDSLRDAGIEGSVWVRVLVDTSGTVAKAVIQKTSGHLSMDEAAIAAAGKSIFKPAVLEGKKVRLWVSYEIKFVLRTKKP